jgi:predicted permease
MDDERLGAPLVALLGYRYWQSHYNGDPDIVGKTIRFSADAATIVGVLGDDQSPAPDKILMPLQATPDRRGARQYAVYARLRDGVTLAQAQHDTDALLAGLAASPLYAHLGTTITRRYDSETASRRPTMNVLFGAVGFVLLIACVNVASLQLARGSTRNVEFAIRSSLGAGRIRLVRQLIVESLVLSLIGCALGCLVAWLTLGTIVANLPMYLPSAVRITITWPALLAAAAVALVSGVAFGLMPAFRSSRSDLTRVLGRATRAGHGALSRTAGRVLITIEIAAAVILLVGATLMVVSFARLADVPLGFDTDRFVTIEATPIDDRSDAYRAYYASLLERIRALPGVDSAGGTNMLPLGGSYSFGQVETAHGKRGVILSQATPGYFETLDITLRAGRLPQGRDFDDANWVVFSENAATSLFPNEPAVGQSVRIADTWRTVIGVVGDVKDQGAVRVLKAPGTYTSFQTAPDRTLSGRDIGQPMIVVAHAAVMDGAFMDALRRAASEAAPSVIRAVRPSHEWWSDNVVTPRQRTVLLSILGGLGLLLALVGVFGVTSFSISRRTAEIGVRTAFGATGGHIIRMVMRDTWLPIAGGLALGLAGAAYLSKLIESFLFQTTSRDPPSFAAAAVILAMCGLAAAWLPARRAAQIDPVAALRQE